MRGIVPETIIMREMVGFGTPERAWLSKVNLYIKLTMDMFEKKDLPFFNNAREEVLRSINSSNRWPSHAWRIFNIYAWCNAFEIDAWAEL